MYSILKTGSSRPGSQLYEIFKISKFIESEWKGGSQWLGGEGRGVTNQ